MLTKFQSTKFCKSVLLTYSFYFGDELLKEDRIIFPVLRFSLKFPLLARGPQCIEKTLNILKYMLD